METLSLNVEGGIAHVQLCRPEALNRMTPAFWAEMRELFSALDARADVRVVVLSAQGRHFTAGLDLSMAGDLMAGAELDAGRVRERLRRTILQMQESFSRIERLRVPVIAVLQGGCIGGGVDLVTACDIRIGTADCFLKIAEIDVGIVADVGTLQRLPHLLPQGLVRELAFTGRDMRADEAQRWGLLNSVEADAASALAAAMDMARQIAAKTPLAITGIKHVLNHGRGRTIEDGLDHVATWNAAMLMSADMPKAVQATMSKTPASFDDLLD